VDDGHVDEIDPLPERGDAPEGRRRERAVDEALAVEQHQQGPEGW
jgi:hypothetical protein